MNEKNLPLNLMEISSASDIIEYLRHLDEITKGIPNSFSDISNDPKGNFFLTITRDMDPKTFSSPPPLSVFRYIFTNDKTTIGQQLKVEPRIQNGKIVTPRDGNTTIFEELKSSSGEFSKAFVRSTEELIQRLLQEGLPLEKMTYSRNLEIRYNPYTPILETTQMHELSMLNQRVTNSSRGDIEESNISFVWASTGVIDETHLFTRPNLTHYQQLIQRFLAI